MDGQSGAETGAETGVETGVDAGLGPTGDAVADTGTETGGDAGVVVDAGVEARVDTAADVALPDAPAADVTATADGAAESGPDAVLNDAEPDAALDLAQADATADHRAPDAVADHRESDAVPDDRGSSVLTNCPAWPDWPMPAPVSLTGIPGDPTRRLPHPQSYDTSNPDLVIDNVTHLAWQKALSLQQRSWNDADRYCNDLVLGGRTDWRLPARIEVVSLIDFTREGFGNVNAGAFPDAPAQGKVWACTSAPANPLWAWVVDFGNGGTAIDDKTMTWNVRCVAGSVAQTPPPARYDVSTPGEVHDLKTGLIWQSNVLAGALTWGQGYSDCDTQGWRLPSLTEAQTLIDETQSISAVDATAFPDHPDDFFWTSSFFDGLPNLAWFASIGIGNTYWIPVTEAHRARCVR